MSRPIGILLLSMLLFTACKPGRKLPEGAPAKMRPSALKEKMQEAQNEYESLRIRGMGSFSSEGQQQNFRFEARLLRDSLVRLDVADPILGIKVARALVTPDSVAFINRLNKEYFTGEITALQEEFDLDFNFNDLQNILSANMLFNVQQDFELYYRPGLYLLSDFDPEARNPSQLAGKEDFRQVLVDPRFFKPVEQVQQEPASGKRYQVDFKKLQQKSEGLIYPELIQLEYLDDKPVNVKFDINKVEKDDPGLNYPFNIPSGYAKMR